jgi:hypothetical protein
MCLGLSSPAWARLEIDEQEADYLFRYFADSDHVHVSSHYGNYGLELINGGKLAVQWNREAVIIPAVEAPAGSQEAVDAITTASRPIARDADAFEDFTKIRNEITGELGYKRVNVGYYVSKESDYFAQQVKGNVDRDFFGQNLNLSAGTSYSWDSIEPLADQDGTSEKDTKTTVHVNVVATQVVTPTTLLRVGGEFNFVEGLQHNPYRSVYAGGGPVRERHPDKRDRRDLFVKVTQYFGNQSSIRGEYRLYNDDWGIDSHTLGARLSQYVTDRMWVRYRYRYYTQDAADFARDEYETSDGIDGYRTGDYRLTELSSHLFGATLDVNLGTLSSTSTILQQLGLTLTYERYFNSNNFSANVLESGLTFRF